MRTAILVEVNAVPLTKELSGALLIRPRQFFGHRYCFYFDQSPHVRKKLGLSQHDAFKALRLLVEDGLYDGASSRWFAE